MATGEWAPNPFPRWFWLLDLLMYPTISLILFFFSLFVLPGWLQEAPKPWIVALVTVGPLLMMAWSLAVGAMAPRRIRLEPTVLLWDNVFGGIHRISKTNILRLEPLQQRRHGLAMCFFLDHHGKERWIPVTIANEERIRAWLAEP